MNSLLLKLKLTGLWVKWMARAESKNETSIRWILQHAADSIVVEIGKWLYLNRSCEHILRNNLFPSSLLGSQCSGTIESGARTRRVLRTD